MDDLAQCNQCKKLLGNQEHFLCHLCNCWEFCCYYQRSIAMLNRWKEPAMECTNEELQQIEEWLIIDHDRLKHWKLTLKIIIAERNY